MGTLIGGIGNSDQARLSEMVVSLRRSAIGSCQPGAEHIVSYNAGTLGHIRSQLAEGGIGNMKGLPSSVRSRSRATRFGSGALRSPRSGTALAEEDGAREPRGPEVRREARPGRSQEGAPKIGPSGGTGGATLGDVLKEKLGSLSVSDDEDAVGDEAAGEEE
jgi:hypothetical protein